MENEKITIPVEEFARLVKHSAILEIVADYVESEEYMNKKDLMRLLGIKESAGES